MKTLRAWMAEHAETDESLAGKLDTDRTTISRLRRGKQRPSWSLLPKLIEITRGEITADSFLVLDEGGDETSDEEAPSESHPPPAQPEAALRLNQSVIRSARR